MHIQLQILQQCRVLGLTKTVSWAWIWLSWSAAQVFHHAPYREMYFTDFADWRPSLWNRFYHLSVLRKRKYKIRFITSGRWFCRCSSSCSRSQWILKNDFLSNPPRSASVERTFWWSYREGCYLRFKERCNAVDNNFQRCWIEVRPGLCLKSSFIAQCLKHLWLWGYCKAWHFRVHVIFAIFFKYFSNLWKFHAAKFNCS